MAANTRRLTKVIRRLEEFGSLGPTLINFYKNQEPFFYFDPSDGFDLRFPLSKSYVSNLAKADHYEGEVDGCGNAYGRGIKLKEFHDVFVISEGFFKNGVEVDGFRRMINFVKKDGTCQMITGTF
jgi:hypothetical protein